MTGARGIPIGDGTLVAVYLGLAAGVAWMLLRFSRMPVDLSDAGTSAVAHVMPSIPPERSRAR